MQGTVDARRLAPRRAPSILNEAGRQYTNDRPRFTPRAKYCADTERS